MFRISEFTYTKENGAQSSRIVAVTQEGGNLEGIDITELDEEEFARFIVDYKEHHEKQKEALTKLLAEHDLKHNFRAFKQSGITDINHMGI